VLSFVGERRLALLALWFNPRDGSNAVVLGDGVMRPGPLPPRWAGESVTDVVGV